ncbi:hypothetical protein A2U01_0114162, partial [Trifolium medium]|nr:hypothetical protein [Trifolium medium]
MVVAARSCVLLLQNGSPSELRPSLSEASSAAAAA